MFRNFKMVSRVIFGQGCFQQLRNILHPVKTHNKSFMVFMVDDVFKSSPLNKTIPLDDGDMMLWVNVNEEPTTQYVDTLVEKIRVFSQNLPGGIVGIGGGSTMDLAKAVSLMLTNSGSSANYQGWDLVKNPGIYHAGIPTLSGTGAEVSRTTVLCGPDKKLGINSDHTVFDQIVLDPELTVDAPADQRFYTGMDCYIHCIESLSGTFLNTFSKSYGEKALQLCRKVFLEGSSRGVELEESLMMASYCGGMSIAYSQVGICHALSYGLSFVFGIHHGIGNCIAFNALDEYYPEGVSEFRKMMDINQIGLPKNLTKDYTPENLEKMVDVALALEPLWENALGKDWKNTMTREKIKELYQRM
ncbi:MAG: iron-containing alcohol dehydrogenase family protein [Desulfobacterales bacterium]